MNLELTKNIIKHIFSSLMIIPCDFINYDKNRSLLSKDFILDQTLDLNDGITTFNNKIWGIESDVAGKKLSLLVGNCSLDKDVLEYGLIVKLEESPTYGLYLISNEDYNPDALLACTLDGKSWMECSTYLQATFLAGMEQIKDLNINWKRIEIYTDEFELLKSFLEFHNSIYGEQ